MHKALLSQNKWIVEAQVTRLKSYVKCEISSVNNKTESLFERLNKIFSTEKKYNIKQEIQHCARQNVSVCSAADVYLIIYSAQAYVGKR